MVNIGIEVEADTVRVRPNGAGKAKRLSPFRIQCRALGLSCESYGLATGLNNMRRLRVEEIERRLGEKPGDWELGVLLEEARTLRASSRPSVL